MCWFIFSLFVLLRDGHTQAGHQLKNCTTTAEIALLFRGSFGRKHAGGAVSSWSINDRCYALHRLASILMRANPNNLENFFSQSPWVASLVKTLTRDLHTASTHRRSQMIWAVAKFSINNAALLSAFAAVTVTKAHQLNAQEISTAVWAFGRLLSQRPKVDDVTIDLLEKLAHAAVANIHQFNSHSLANLAWGFGALSSTGYSPSLSTSSSHLLSAIAERTSVTFIIISIFIIFFIIRY
jgi:hypothetical protein